MTPLQFGIMIRVNDLDGCRIFYRDLLELGEPVLDSSFLVVFQLSEDLTLTLEKSAAPYLEHASSACLWGFETEDLDGLRRRLEDAGYELALDADCRDPSCDLRGRDPEGNLFRVRRPRGNRQTPAASDSTVR